MVEHDMPDLVVDAGYDEFKTSLEALHRVAAPDCKPGFFPGPLRHIDVDGTNYTYYYFPRPEDRPEVLEHGRALYVNERNLALRSLILPVALLSAHPNKDGNGGLARLMHARLAGKSAAEIARLQICGPRPRELDIDARARSIIDLRPPAALEPIIDAHVYQEAGIAKSFHLQPKLDVPKEDLEAYKDLLYGHVTPDCWMNLGYVIQWARVVGPGGVHFVSPYMTKRV